VRQSGSQRDYCRQHGIDGRVLRKWRTRLYGPVRPSADGIPDSSEPKPAVREFAYAVPGNLAPVAGETGGALVLRRRWTTDQKRQLVWDGLNSGMPLARFARQHGIRPSVMHRWLKGLTRPILTAGPATPPMFAAVRVAEPSLLTAPEAPSPAPVAAPDTCHGMIEIVLAGDRRIRVGSDVDAEALRRVVAVLDSPA
jgi:transposase